LPGFPDLAYQLTMIRRLALALLVLFTVFPVTAIAFSGISYWQGPATVTLTANHLTLGAGGTVVPDGSKLCVMTTDANDRPAGYRLGGSGGQTSASTDYQDCRATVAGAIVSPLIVINSAASAQLNACIRVTLFAPTGAEIRHDKCFQTGTSQSLASGGWCSNSGGNITCSYDDYPIGTAPNAVIQKGQKGDKGDTGDAAVVTSNGANGDFSAPSFNHSFLLSATTPMIDVRAYGATCNSGVDDTAHIQAAMNVAAAVGGTVYFPPCTLAVNGPVLPSCNGILCVPEASLASPTQFKLQGTTKIRQDSEGTGTTGTVLVTNQTVGINFDSAIIAVPQATIGFGFQNLDLYVSDIEFKVPVDPHIGCIMAQWAAGADIEHIRCWDGQNWSIPVRTWPTYHLNGIVLPGVNNDTLSVFKYSEVSGIDTGIVASEHSDIEESTLSFGNVGINYQAGYHTANASLVQSQDMGTAILFTGGPLPVNIQGLDIQQCINVVPSQCNSGIDISDPNNFGYGHMSYAKVGDDGSVGKKLVTDGAGFIDTYDMYNNEWSIGAFQRSTFTVGGGKTPPDVNKIIANVCAEYWDIDTCLGSSALRPDLAAADPSRVGVLQVYQGGVKHTRGTLPGNLNIQTVDGSGTNIGNKQSNVVLGYLGDGLGFEVASGAGCNYTAGQISNFCNTTLSLPVTQLDTNYKVTGCMIENTTANPFTGTPFVSSVLALTTTSITVTTSSMSTTGTGGGLIVCKIEHNAFR
jgi:hypothetical protein